MKNYSIAAFFIVFALGFWNCRGDQQNKVVGKWEQISFYEPDSSNRVFWQFFAGDALIIYHVTPDGTDSIQFTYSISSNTFDVFSGIDDPTYSPAARDPRGQYWIDLLKNDQLKATKTKHPDGTTDAVYMRLELVKR